MDDLILILRIEEGVGFFKKSYDNIIAIASLSNNQLESDIVVSSSTTTLFNANLIWETDRASVKRMKQENLPVRIECFAVNLKNGGSRDFIGYILLPIRSVAIQVPSKAFVGSAHWHKLIGLAPDWKDFKPQLLLFVSITNREVFKKFDKQNFSFDHETKLSKTVDSIVSVPEGTTSCDIKNKIPVKMCNDYYEIGKPQSGQKFYNLILHLNHLKNLDKLLQESDALNQNFLLGYTIMINDQKEIDYVELQRTDNSFVADKLISLKFKSTNEVIELFFENNVLVRTMLCYGDKNNVFGFGNLSIEQLNNKIPNDIRILKICCDNRGSCDLNYSLSLNEMDGRVEIFGIDDNVKPLASPRNNFPEIETRNELDSISGLKIIDADGIKLKKTSKTANLKTIKSNIEEEKLRHTFSLNLVLNLMKFHRKPDCGVWQFSLQHQKADTTFTIVNLELTDITTKIIELNNLTLALYFSSYIDDILDIIDTEPCILVMCGPRNISARAELDSTTLLSQTSSQHHGVVLMDNQTGENIIIAEMYIHLDDLGVSFNSQIKKHPSTMAQPYFDEKYAYKIVEELESWKAKEEKFFIIELKQKEREFLSKLSVEWNERKRMQDLVLSKKIEECMKLTDELESTKTALREKSIHNLHGEEILHTTRIDLEKGYSTKFLELEEKYRRQKIDHEHKLKIEELRFKELEITKSFIEKENISLRQQITLLEDKISDMSTNYFSKEQLSSIFQELLKSNERLTAEQKSKNFYKEKWAKLLRHMNKIQKQSTFNDMIFDDSSDNKSMSSDDDLVDNERKVLLDKLRNFDV